MTMTAFQDSEILAIWDEIFSSDAYRLRVAEIESGYPQERSVFVKYPDIDLCNTDFAMFLLDKPDRCLKLGKQSLKSMFPPTWEPENDVNLRITELPKDAHVGVRDLRSKHLNKLVAIEGMVTKATPPKLKMTRALYRCAKCDAEQWIPQKGMYATEPLMCTNEGCNKTALRFILDEANSVFSDSQKVEIQENPEGLKGGAQPERISGYIEDDIAGKVTPGYRITLNGIVRPVEKSDRDKSIVFDVFMDVQSIEFSQEEYDEIEITEEDEKRILETSKDPEFFNNLVRSISPTIYGHKEVKEGIALQLFGGSHKDMDDKSSLRGDIHILLVGDPGVAKSQILSYMARLAPRGIFASGKSASAAGLCVGADTVLANNKGETEKIGDFVNARMTEPEEYRPGIWRQAVVDEWAVQSIGELGSVRYLPITYVWKIKTPEKLYKVSAGGQSLILTQETKIQAMKNAIFDWVEAKELSVGDLVSLVGTNMRLQPIDNIEILTGDLPEYVYDLTVEPAHAFIGNGFVIHNTAAAVKDDFGEGRWTLEAGALVLADKGLACIDELDKMTSQDRSSLHEAMESQSISVAKAGITAKLQSRCSLLAAANPKFGRFDPDEKISDQIDLPPALMSRFDLIYVLRDIPNEENDRRITSHILRTQRRGQALMMKKENIESVDREKILADTNDIKPVYDAEFIRKYVSYAKRNCVPVMTDVAQEIIQKDYLCIRKGGDDKGSAVPITARQLEAYVRLSEASAKTRLSDTVEEQDAARAIDIINHYLEKIAGTKDGTFDIDANLNTISHKERKTMVKIVDAIRMALSETPDMTIDELSNKLPDISISALKDTLNNLKKTNVVYFSNEKEGRYSLV